jgi:transposase-like protein
MVEQIELVKRSGVTVAVRAAAWERIVQAQRESGLTIRAFASQHDLRASALYRWGAKLRELSPVGSSGFVEIQAPASASEEACALELHGAGVHVRVHNGCEAQLLRTLITLMEERSC